METTVSLFVLLITIVIVLGLCWMAIILKRKFVSLIQKKYDRQIKAVGKTVNILDELTDKFFESATKLIIVLVVIGASIFVLIKIFGFFGGIGKHEGQNAKEWYYDYADVEDRYQKFRDCVEEYDSFDIRTQLNYGGIFYYCE